VIIVNKPNWKLVPAHPTPLMCAAGFCVNEAEHDPAGVYLAMIAAAPAQPDDCTADLSRLVSRLALALRKADPDSILPQAAQDFLTRKGLIGSPLRIMRALETCQQFCVDGTDEQGNQAGDAKDAPFFIFDIDNQKNVAGPYATHEYAFSVLTDLRLIGQHGFGVYAINCSALDSKALFAVAGMYEREDGFYHEALSIDEVITAAWSYVQVPQIKRGNIFK
jgi:hypothetical protein